MELYPPCFLMRVKVKDISNGWRRIRVKLPLNFTSRNPGGVMFGGYQACVADPFPAIACGRIFPEYSAWTRAMTVDFQKAERAIWSFASISIVRLCFSPSLHLPHNTNTTQPNKRSKFEKSWRRKDEAHLHSSVDSTTPVTIS